MPRDYYKAPALTRRIIIRVSSDEFITRDNLARPTSDPVFPNEIEVWAARRDRGAHTLFLEGTAPQPISTVVFTIRFNPDVTKEHYVIDDMDRYDLQGPPLRRAMKGGGSDYMELHTELSLK